MGISKTFAKVMDTAVTTAAHPIKVASAVVSPKTKVSDVVKEYYSQPVSKQNIQLATTIGTIAAGVVAAGTSAGRIAVTKIIPTTLKGKVTAAVAAPVIIGAVSKQPAETAQAIIKAPQELAQFGADVAEFGVNPSASTAKQIVMDSPVISAALGTAAAVAGARTILPAVSSYLTRQEMEEQTQAFERQAAASEKLLETPLSYGAAVPVTPERQTITAGTSTTKKKKYARRKAKIPSMVQKVNVMVSNKSSSTGIRQNKKYLNREILLN